MSYVYEDMQDPAIYLSDQRLEDMMDALSEMQQMSDTEQQKHELLDALHRIELSGALRSDVESLALGLGLISELHEPVVHWSK